MHTDPSPYPKPILIAGPTASGKSALALALAERLGGTIINADSMQVYRELRVLTARPSADEEARVPHLLYGFVAACDAFSVGRYADCAGRAIAEVRAGGRVPIVVGGTGLYFKVLTEGLSPIPPIADEIRAYWRREAQRLGAEALHGLLAEKDPAMAARLSPTDPQRVVRALEVVSATGRSLAEWQARPGVPVVDAREAVRLVIAPDRAEVYRRSGQRFEAMLERGAIEEVRRLMAQGLDPSLPAMRALGIRPLMQLLRGEIDRQGAITAGQAETRQYIKRQMTWLRRHMSTWKWPSAQEMECMRHGDFAFIDSQH